MGEKDKNALYSTRYSLVNTKNMLKLFNYLPLKIFTYFARYRFRSQFHKHQSIFRDKKKPKHSAIQQLTMCKRAFKENRQANVYTIYNINLDICFSFLLPIHKLIDISSKINPGYQRMMHPCRMQDASVVSRPGGWPDHLGSLTTHLSVTDQLSAMYHVMSSRSSNQIIRLVYTSLVFFLLFIYNRCD